VKLPALILSFLLSAGAVAPSPSIELIPVRGSCEAFNRHREAAGITDENGLPHPGYAGWTTATVTYGYSSRYTIERDRGRVRLDATIDVKFTGKAVPARLDWRPPHPLSPGCRRDKERWERQVDAHEMRHVRDFDALMRAAVNPWKHGWELTVTGATESEAKAKLDRTVMAALKAVARRILDQNNAASDAFHRSPAGGPVTDLDCDLCRDDS
jgi:hypothetical protein